MNSQYRILRESCNVYVVLGPFLLFCDDISQGNRDYSGMTLPYSRMNLRISFRGIYPLAHYFIFIANHSFTSFLHRSQVIFSMRSWQRTFRMMRYWFAGGIKHQGLQVLPLREISMHSNQHFTSTLCPLMGSAFWWGTYSLRAVSPRTVAILTIGVFLLNSELYQFKVG